MKTVNRIEDLRHAVVNIDGVIMAVFDLAMDARAFVSYLGNDGRYKVVPSNCLQQGEA